jgi:alpha-mannosidase
VIPSQVITDGTVTKLVFTAENIPSMGFKEFKIFNTAATVTAGVTATNGAVITLDNQFCTVKVDKTTGAITSIVDKINSKELLSAPGNRIASTTSTPKWWDDCCDFYSHYPSNMPAALTYKTPTAVTLVDSGPAMARIKATYVENGVNWDHYIMLFSKVPVAANRMVTANLTSNNELSVNIPLATTVSNSSKEWNAGVAFGHHKYVNKAQYTPTQKWANVSNAAKDYGVALLENNCTIWSFYGVGGSNDLRLVLLAQQTSRYSGHWSKKDWEMSWGIWGHTGDWSDGAVQKGYEFNSPFIARVESTHAGSLPKTASFLSVDQENIVVTAVKKWESEDPARKDSLTMQVRFYEIDGKNTDPTLTFPGSPSIKAWESMGNEYGVYGNQLAATSAGGVQKVTLAGMTHNQIRSLKVQMLNLPVSIGKNRTPLAGVVSPSQAQPIIRMYNLRGQMISASVGSVSRSSNMQPANGIYLLQKINTNGKSVSSKQLVSSGRAK